MSGQPIPFYDRYGEHLITLPIELDDEEKPPRLVELTGPDDESGGTLRRLYQRQPRLEVTPPWCYVEIHSEPLGRIPAPGSAEAAQRLGDSYRWPGP